MRQYYWFLAPIVTMLGMGCKDSEIDLRRQAVTAIKACRGKELQGLDTVSIRRLLGHMSQLGLQRDQDLVDRFGPWHVWDFNASGQPSRYLLFEASKKFRMGNELVHPHPGRTMIYLTLIDYSGNVIAETHLTTGWRCYLRAASLHSVHNQDYPLLTLETELGTGPGPDISRQYYAFFGNRFDLVRLENSSGKATRNRYFVRHFRCGTSLADLIDVELEAGLMSSDRSRILRSLVWLGGVHWNLKPPEFDVDTRQFEIREQVLMWQRVHASEPVIGRIRDLMKSEDVWLREAAELAANPLDDDF